MKPFFKPGYSGITALSLDMFGAGWACKKNLYFSASAPHSGRADEEPGAGFDFALRCLKLAGSAMHIPRVLYSVGAPRHAIPERAGVAAIERFCSPLGERLRATGGKYQGSFRTGCRAWPPKTSIVIPNRDDVDSLRACLETIEETSSIFEPELIIADGGSVSERTNKYYEILAGNKAARIVRAKGGFGALSNAGALEASGDALLFLSRDARLASPGLIPALAEQAGRRGAGCAGALVLDENGRIVSSGNTAGLSGMLSSPFEGAEYGSLSGRTFETYIDTVRATLAVSGVCMYVRTDVFRSAGGFDESYFMNAEEVDLQRRLRESSIPSLMIPTVEVLHEGGGSSDSQLRRTWLVQARDHYARKWGHPRLLRGGLYLASAVNFGVNAVRGAFGRDESATTVFNYERRLVRNSGVKS